MSNQLEQKDYLVRGVYRITALAAALLTKLLAGVLYWAFSNSKILLAVGCVTVSLFLAAGLAGIGQELYMSHKQEQDNIENGTHV